MSYKFGRVIDVLTSYSNNINSYRLMWVSTDIFLFLLRWLTNYSERVLRLRKTRRKRWRAKRDLLQAKIYFSCQVTIKKHLKQIKLQNEYPTTAPWFVFDHFHLSPTPALYAGHTSNNSKMRTQIVDNYKCLANQSELQNFSESFGIRLPWVFVVINRRNILLTTN